MAIEYLLVTFKENRTVLADDDPVGVTNHILMLPTRGYEIKLDGTGYSPTSQTINLLGTSIVRPMIVVFS
ncbi:MAG TPA: hypothetical protein VLI93_14110 [Acetobacteraceae bacterium]|nr:hypothetical protein [Acetobacteraceae bacterium]